MMQPTSPASTVTIRGKAYVPVVERVRQAHAGDGFSMLASEVLPVGDTGRYIVRVTIAIGEARYIGTAEVHLSAKPGTADGDSPIETAETSALGRALGFAGFGLIDSIASANEVRHAANGRQPTPTPYQSRATVQAR